MTVRLISRSNESVDSDASVDDLIADAINIIRRGNRTELSVCWEVGKRVHRVSEAANSGDRVLEDFASRMTKETGDAFSVSSLSRYRAIHRLIPEASEVEKLSDSGVRRTHLYRLIQHDVSSDHQRSILDLVLKGKILPTQVEQTVKRVLAGEPVEAVISDDDEGSPAVADGETESGPADSPEVVQFKKRVSQVSKAADAFKGKVEKFTSRVNDDFDGLDRPQQEEVEPGLSELLDLAISLQKSVQVLSNSIKGCI